MPGEFSHCFSTGHPLLPYLMFLEAMRWDTVLDSQQAMVFWAQLSPLVCVRKGSWKPLASCYPGQLLLETKPREFLPAVITSAVCFMGSMSGKVFLRAWGVVTTSPSLWLILPRSAKPGDVYACGALHLGSGEETFWSQQEEDGREAKRLWFWGKDEGAQRRGEALCHFLFPP